MLIAWIAAYAVLAFFILLPVVWEWRLVRHFHRSFDLQHAALGPAMKVAVILPLRGADPFLERCLHGLLHQEYPAYTLFIVLDHEDDPARPIVERILARGHPSNVDIHVEVMTAWGKNCGLKNSAQLQVLSRLDKSFDVVTFTAADSIVAPDWLTSMTAPFADPKVGVASGLRWFTPRDCNWGTLVRHLYNAASFGQMYVFHLPWGGSQSMRCSILRETDILEYWGRCICEDTATYATLRKLGLRIEYVTKATHFNRETIDLPGAYEFIRRQLMCVRLHHVLWPVMLFANLANFIALVAAIGLAAVGLVSGDTTMATISVGLFGFYCIGMLSALTVGERLLWQRSDPPPPPISTWKLVPATIVTQVLSIYAMIETMFMRSIDWRGVTYAIDGRDRIRLVEYKPYRAPVTKPGNARSVL
jgi:cellulose synthase/poly-beta-1,6-N-acetylglucosamine synthase-like glycosyltransferase